MARYDVCPNLEGPGLLLNVQMDLLSDIATPHVVPAKGQIISTGFLAPVPGSNIPDKSLPYRDPMKGISPSADA